MPHSPGPWTVGELCVYASADDFQIAEVYGRTPEEADANMRLMGAALDLLMALKYAVGTITYHPNLQGNEQALWPVPQTIQQALVAIARAEGTL